MENATTQNFRERAVSFIPHLKPYVKKRLYTAEIKGIIPRNMYKAIDIIDDALVLLFEEQRDNDIPNESLRVALFSKAALALEQLFEREEFHRSTMSTGEILSQELEKMEQHFEMDIDNDLLLREELDDISYHQNSGEKPMLLYSDAEENLIKALDINNDYKALTEDNRLVLNKIYNWLPMETSDILNLLVFGKLNYDEIAIIKGINREEVKATIQSISRGLRKNIN